MKALVPLLNNRFRVRTAIAVALLAQAGLFSRSAVAQVVSTNGLQAVVQSTISGVDIAGDTLFTRLSAGAVVRGRIVAYDEALHRLLFFDEAGRLVRRVDKTTASAEVDLKTVAWLGRCAPHLVFVADGVSKRITVMDAYGNVIRTFRFPALARQLSCSENGRLGILMLPNGMRGETAVAPLVVLDAWGTEVRRLVGIPVGGERFGAALTSVALSRDALFIGTGRSARVAVVRADYSHVDSITLGRLESRPMSKAEYQTLVFRRFARLWPDSVVRKVQQMPHPQFHPLYRDVYATPSGTLWATVSPASANTTTFRSVSSRGEHIGEISVACVARLLEADDGKLLVACRDGSMREKLLRVAVKLWQ